MEDVKESIILESISALKDQVRAAAGDVSESIKRRDELYRRLREAEEATAFAGARQLHVGDLIYPEGMSLERPLQVVVVDTENRCAVLKDKRTCYMFTFSSGSGWVYNFPPDHHGFQYRAYIR